MRSLYPDTMRFTETGSRVAVIMRTKNRPMLLVRALASVLQQKHQDWHLYLVNDGGDKQQLEKLIEPYRPSFAGRLTVIHNENSLGMAAAANSALQQAEGDFIAVHDDDDAWHSDFLQKTVAFLNKDENRNYVAVATQCEAVYEQLQENSIRELWRQPWGEQNKKILSFADMLQQNSIVPITLLIRKKAADIVGLYNAALPVLDNWDYYLRLLQIGDIGKIDSVLAYYYHRTESKDTYGNSVHAGKNIHEHTQILYANALLRNILAENPQNLGLLQLIAACNKKHTDKFNEVLGQNYWLYGKLRDKIRYSGLFGKIRQELTHFCKKLRKKH